ncbi:MAG TPA: proline racemase family protein [Pirellulales bacterium]
MHAASLERIQVVDTHTGGEPTRVVVAGGPDLGAGPLEQRRERLRREFDWFRSATVCEPRGNDVMVGAILVPPVEQSSAAGVIFFNNVGCLGMCGHGTMGVVVALGHLGKLAAGSHRLDTPVGAINVEYDGENAVSFENVASFRQAAAVTVDVAGLGRVTGDVAWGGNWFFLVYDHGEQIVPANVERLTDVAWRIRTALAEKGVTGRGGEQIDHIELFGPPTAGLADSRSFVLCPGKAYDRSPCGTGTSAKLACLYADGRLQPGGRWRQESIVGSVFEGSVKIVGERIVPRVSGTAYVTAESTLLLDARDPFRAGIHA